MEALHWCADVIDNFSAVGFIPKPHQPCSQVANNLVHVFGQHTCALITKNVLRPIASKTLRDQTFEKNLKLHTTANFRHRHSAIDCV